MVKLILGNITFITTNCFETQRATVHSIEKILYCTSVKDAEEIGEFLTDHFDAYLVPSSYQGEIIYECPVEDRGLVLPIGAHHMDVAHYLKTSLMDMIIVGKDSSHLDLLERNRITGEDEPRERGIQIRMPDFDGSGLAYDLTRIMPIPIVAFPELHYPEFNKNTVPYSPNPHDRADFSGKRRQRRKR